MKLIDALRNVNRPADDRYCTVDFSEICTEIGISASVSWNTPDELDQRFKSYPLATWCCTDTHVGYHAIWMDGEPVGYSFQSARKSDTSFRWISQEVVDRMRAVIMSYNEPENTSQFLDPNEDISEFYTVSYVSQLLTDEGFYEGRSVKALVRYDGLTTWSTPAKYRSPDRAYTVAVPYEDPKHNCVLVQDGDEQRIIPISEFKIPINVTLDVAEDLS